MVDRVKKYAKIVSEKDGFWMFLRAQISAQIATIFDFLITIILAKTFSLYYVYATFSGSLLGGVVNCVINYKWTFKSRECGKLHVALKYMLVWLGSLFLNVSGVYFLTESFSEMIWIQNLFGYRLDDLFIVSKFFVALAVALLWNYNMQRIFVYKSHNVWIFSGRKSEIRNIDSV